MPNDDTDSRGTATHFAEWVFKKTNPTYCREEHESKCIDLKRLGQFGHEDIEKQQLWMSRIKAAQGLTSNWKIRYADPHDGKNSDIFYASKLSVDGKPMRCRPDVVLCNQDTGIKLIIERKTTSRKEELIPPNAWPNIRVQLWCYGWIDEWANDNDVILVCQYFRRRFDDYDWRYQDEKNPWIRNYDVYPDWLRSDSAFHSECLQYFKEYGGSFQK